MVDEKILVKGPPTEPRYRASFVLAPEFADQLKVAERAARREGRAGDSGSAISPEVHGGQRLLLIGGERLDEIVGALRRSPASHHAEWMVRLDGGNQRLLIALPDDGLLADGVETAVQKARGEVLQVRVDRLVEMADLDPCFGEE